MEMHCGIWVQFIKKLSTVLLPSTFDHTAEI